jgi:hypothetical protein
MTRAESLSSTSPDPVVPQFSVAGAFLEGLAAHDFGRLAATLRHDVHLRALLPRGFFEWDGCEEVKGAFTNWLGDVDRFELVDAVVGEVGARLHLRWRVRMQASRLGDGWFVVEQQAYVDADEADRIRHISLLCSGYCSEHSNG